MGYFLAAVVLIVLIAALDCRRINRQRRRPR
jgi:hypothetical protein